MLALLLTGNEVCLQYKGKGKGSSFPLQSWTGPDGFQEVEAATYRQSGHEGTKVVSSTHRPTLPPTKYSWYSFLLEIESTPGP